MMDESTRPTLSKMVIGSVDTLRGTSIGQEIPPEWNCDPPLLLKVPRPRMGRGKEPTQEENERLLKGMVRLGIPPALRCAVWISNIIQVIHSQETQLYWLEYRTLSKVRVLDAAYQYVLEQIVPTSTTSRKEHNSDNNNESHRENNDTNRIQESPVSSFDLVESTTNGSIELNKSSNEWDTVEVWSFGRSDDATTIDGILPSGMIALKKVLVALERILGIGHAPLIPTLASLFLTCMSESYTFCAIREMAHQSASGYFPVSAREHTAWCYAFGDILRKLHPATAEYLEDRGVLDVNGLNPIFQDFWIGILPLQYIQRILDIYTLEGSKVLFRFGVSLLVLYKIESAESLITISNCNEWWHTMRNWAHSKRFRFDLVVRKAYGVHGHGIRRQMNFPRRNIIQRIILLEQAGIRRSEIENDTFVDDTDSLTQPLGLVQRQQPIDGEIAIPVLVQSQSVRLVLAKWLPITLRLSNLDLLYSTNNHGRTLERFYAHVKNARHTILVCEVLQGKNDKDDEPPVILGMYASQAWRVSPRVYGDGGVFLFRLQPNEVCWKWQPARQAAGDSIMDQVDCDDDSINNNKIALLEQFMVGTTKFISMGGNADGSCGLRINEDLTKGESSPATGFDNEPLHGKNKGSVFEIGLLEVYGFTRQIDGKSV